MDWDKLRIFHAVASAGSFTHAGQMLTLSQSAVSRQISALEEEITTPLFQRHARGLTLTDEGELLFTAVSDVLSRLGQAEEALKNAQSAPRGSLKITTSHGLGTYWVLPRIESFLTEFPELQVHLVFEDRGVKVFVDPESLPLIDGTTVDFVKQGLNEAFRFQNPNIRGECGCGESFSV